MIMLVALTNIISNVAYKESDREREREAHLINAVNSYTFTFIFT